MIKFIELWKKGEKRLLPIIYCIRDGDKKEAGIFIYNLTRKFQIHSNRTQRGPTTTISKLKKYPQIIFLKTDKSCKKHGVNKTNYINKMNSCINDMNCEILKKYPNLSIFTKTQELVRRGSLLENMQKFIKINNTGLTPRLVVQLLDHIPGLPMRPNAVRWSGSMYFVEKAFVQFLKLILPHSNTALYSTEEYIWNIQCIHISKDTMLAISISLYWYQRSWA